MQNLPWGGTNGGGQNFTPAPLDFRKDNELTSLALRGEFGLSDTIKVTSLTSYSHFTRREGYDTGGWDIENLIGLLVDHIVSSLSYVKISQILPRSREFDPEKVRKAGSTWVRRIYKL